MVRPPLAVPLSVVLASCGAGHIEADVRLETGLPAGLTHLQVRIPLGSVAVHAGPDGQLRLVGRSRKTAPTAADLERLRAVDFSPTLAPTAVPGEFLLSMPELPAEVDPKEAAMIVRAELYLPRGVPVDVEVVRGHLSVVGRDAAVRLRTGSGDLQVEDVDGRIRAFTGLGKVILHRARGTVDVESGGGAILAYVERIDADGVRLKTAEPSLTVHLPAAAGFDLDARVVRSNEGKIGVRNSFGVPVVPDGAGHAARGPVGGGGPRVALEVGAGWISAPALDSD